MDRLIEKYNLDEIAKKTHISPLSLKRLLNYEFDKLDSIKIKGFIKILETEYPEFDFFELKEAFEEYSKKDEEDIIEIEESDNTKVYLIVFIIILVVGGLYYVLNKNTQNNKNVEENKTIKTETTKVEVKKSEEIKPKIKEIIPQTISKVEENKTDNNFSIKKDTFIDEKVVITPIERVWFKVTYLDENKSKEYLTSNEVDLNGSKRIFIKFGHGMIKIDYNGKKIEPNTRKIIRVIIENGEINITKKRVKEFE